VHIRYGKQLQDMKVVLSLHDLPRGEWPTNSPAYKLCGWLMLALVPVAFVVIIWIPIEATIAKLGIIERSAVRARAQANTPAAARAKFQTLPPAAGVLTISLMGLATFLWRRVRRLPPNTGPNGGYMYPGVRERAADDVVPVVVFTVIVGLFTWLSWSLS